jgi:ADP-ribosylglycohydrolase/catechol 2,3-dioxygenase-like lactoylglutathione lyase family enzyme
VAAVNNERTGLPAEHIRRAQAAMLAAATGDALGWPMEPVASRVGGTSNIVPQLEFMSWDRREGGRFAPFVRHVEAGTYSDDTQLTLAVARSLLHGQRWWQHLTEVELPLWTLYELGGGGAVRRAAKQWEQGVAPWSEAAKPQDQAKYFSAGGNGAAMRVVPHAICSIADPDFADAATRIIADGITTHGHPRALVGALAAGFATWRALRWEGKVDYGALLEQTIENTGVWATLSDVEAFAPGWREAADSATGDYPELWAHTVEEMVGLLSGASDAISRGSLARDTEVFRALGIYSPEGSAGVRTAAAAIYLASRYMTQPSAGLLAAAFASKADTDTLAAVAGGLLGAMTGGDWLKPLEQDLQDASYIKDIAARVLDARTLAVPVDPAVGVRRRTITKLAAINVEDQMELPVFGAARVTRVEDHPTKSETEIRTWWLATDEGPNIAITRMRKPPPERGRGPSRGRLGTEGRTSGPDHSQDESAPGVYWVSLLVRDLKRSEQFYREAVGLKVDRRSESYVRFGRQLILQQAGRKDVEALDAAVARGDFAAGSLLVFVVDGETLRRRHSELAATKVLVSEIVRSGGEDRFRFRDPDGHTVEIRTSTAPVTAER